MRDYNYIKASNGLVDWESVNKAINTAEKGKKLELESVDNGNRFCVFVAAMLS